MSFPTQVTHRRNRRKLGRGQFPPIPTIGVTVTSTGTTNVTLTFNRPVNVNGNMQNTVATRLLVSQAHPSPNVITQVWDGNVATHAYTVPANDPAVTDAYGGRLAGTGGTFP